MHKILRMVYDASPLRTTHFLLLYLLGFAFASRDVWRVFTLRFLIGALSTIFAWFFVVSINNYFDREVDRKSNPHRGIPSEKYSERELLIFTFSSLIIGAALSLILTLESFLFYLLFVILGYLYSCPRVFLKKFGIKSGIIGLGSALIFGLGVFSLPSSTPSYDFWYIFTIVLVIFSVGSLINDLKDVEADREAGVITPYTLFGRKWGKIVTMALLFIAFTLPILVTPQGFYVFPILGLLSAVLLWFERVKMIYLLYFLEYFLLLYFLL